MLPAPKPSLSSHHITFEEVSEQVHHLRDVILWDVQRGFEVQCESYDMDEASFSNHLMFTKFWFVRVSSVNKKRFCLLLLEKDTPCAWTLSLILKSIWNCRPKDAIASMSELAVWTCYDSTPMDHNRSAAPLDILAEVMEVDRKFYRALDSGRKAVFMLELLKVAGGPIVWAVYDRAENIFESYLENQLENLQETIAVERRESPVKSVGPVVDKDKKNSPRRVSAAGDAEGATTPVVTMQGAERELEVCLTRWSSIIKSIKDSQKLEEVELSFSNGTKKRIWKVNRPKPEVTETVDALQLLPQWLAKRILYYVPYAQLADCARVNRYWAYLVDDFKAEVAARVKIDTDIQKLTQIMLRNDTINQSMVTFRTMTDNSFSVRMSRYSKKPTGNYSKQASQKSGASHISKCAPRDTKTKLPPLRNLAELSERLDRRGAADDSLKDWCKAVLEEYKPKEYGVNLPPLRSSLTKRRSSPYGTMDFGDVTFPCPLLNKRVSLPLKPPLYKDPTNTATYKKKTSNIQGGRVNLQPSKIGSKRYNLWSRDFSSLYTASKIASYKSPV